MGYSSPDQESAHDHELVTEDELLEGDSTPSASPDVFEARRALAMNELLLRRVQVRVGEVLAGKYRVERIHAPGALGVTCDAQHLQLRQRVAVKLSSVAGHG